MPPLGHAEECHALCYADNTLIDVNDKEVIKMPRNNKKEKKESESKEFIGLKEFSSVFIKIVSALAGLAAVFVLIGHIIVLSFLSSINLYGLANFPQVIYTEAAIKFVGDMVGTYGNNYFCSIIMVCFVAIIVMVYLHKGYKEKIKQLFSESSDSLSSQIIKFSTLALILYVILTTLKLNGLRDENEILGIEGFRKVFIFMISLPVFIATFLYMALKFRDFSKRPFRYYYQIAVFFVVLLLAIPISYGRYIYDVEAFPVVELDYENKSIKSLNELKEDIKNLAKNKTFFIIGHTIDRDVFIKISSPPQTILIDRSQIKVLKVSDSKPIREVILSARDKSQAAEVNIDVEMKTNNSEKKDLPENFFK